MVKEALFYDTYTQVSALYNVSSQRGFNLECIDFCRDIGFCLSLSLFFLALLPSKFILYFSTFSRPFTIFGCSLVSSTRLCAAFILPVFFEFNVMDGFFSKRAIFLLILSYSLSFTLPLVFSFLLSRKHASGGFSYF
jgi:hypothetical protein